MTTPVLPADKVQFTPGPWSIVPENDSDYMCINADRGFVCTMDLPPGPERDANARLISAAPELYEALKLALRVVSDRAAGGRMLTTQAEASRIYDMGRAALAKVQP